MTIFARIAAFLIENARLELLSKQFGHSPEDIERVFLPADPTGGKYLTWILRQVRAGQLRFPEDQTKVADRLGQFAQLSRKPQFQGHKDLNQYKTFGELARTVEANAGVQTKGEVTRQKVADGAKLIKEWDGAYNVIEDGSPEVAEGHFAVYAITTFEALDAMGAQQTEWCVKDQSYFDQYAEQGLPYYLATLNGKPFQLMHLPSKQCMNKWDEECGTEVFEDAGIDCWAILEFDDVLNLVAQNVRAAQKGQENDLDKWIARVVKAIGDKDPVFNVAHFCNEFNLSYSKLVVLMKGLKEAGKIEPVSQALLTRIIDDGTLRRQSSNELAFSWSSQILGNRWPEYEAAINWELEQGEGRWFASFVSSVAVYAAEWGFVWPELEETILYQMANHSDSVHISAACDGAYYWANTHEGPWPEMEKLWKGDQTGFKHEFLREMAIYNQHVGYEFFKGMKTYPIPK